MDLKGRDNALHIADKNWEKIKKLKTFDISYFVDKFYFGNNGSQNYLTFQQTSKIFRMPTGDTDTIIAWKPKGLSDESIKTKALTLKR